MYTSSIYIYIANINGLPTDLLALLLLGYLPVLLHAHEFLRLHKLNSEELFLSFFSSFFYG